MRLPFTIFVSVLCLTLLEARPAFSQQNWGTTRPTLVQITVAGPQAVTHETEALLRELLEPRVITLEVIRVGSISLRQAWSQRASAEGVLAQAWIDLTGSERCVLMILDPAGERALLREIDLIQGVDVVAREEVGQIVSASIEAVIAGSEFGVAEAEVAEIIRSGISASGLGLSSDETSVERADEPSAPTPTPIEDPSPLPPPRQAEGRPIGLDIALDYTVGIVSTDHEPNHGPGTILTVSLARVPLRPLLGLGFTYVLPQTVSGTQVGAELEQYLLSFDIGFMPLHRRRVSLGLRLGLIVDFVRLEPRHLQEEDSVTLEPARLEVMNMIGLSTELRVHLVRWLSLVIGIGVEIDAAQTRLIVEHIDGTEVVFQPWWIRPTFRLGFLFNAF